MGKRNPFFFKSRRMLATKGAHGLAPMALPYIPFLNKYVSNLKSINHGKISR
jgi:hypothetical protein